MILGTRTKEAIWLDTASYFASLPRISPLVADYAYGFLKIWFIYVVSVTTRQLVSTSSNELKVNIASNYGVN